MSTQHITLKIKHSELMKLTRSIRDIEHLAMKGSTEEYLGYAKVRNLIESAWVNLDPGETAEWDGEQWQKMRGVL